METIQKTIDLPKEITEIADGTVNILVESYRAFQDGFQASQDLPAILSAAVVNLPTMAGGIENLGEEWKNAKGAFMTAWVLAGIEAYDEISKIREAAKPEEAPAE